MNRRKFFKFGAAAAAVPLVGDLTAEKAAQYGATTANRQRIEDMGWFTAPSGKYEALYATASSEPYGYVMITDPDKEPKDYR